jgi:hypothetical protein
MSWLPGTIIALVAVWISWKSYRLAKESNERSAAEQARLERARSAQAALTAELDFDEKPDATGYIRRDNSGMSLRGTLRVANTGERSAGRTIVDLFIPRVVSNRTSGLVDSGGQPLNDRPFSTQSSYVDVKLDAGEGPVDTWQLRHEFDDVGLTLPAEARLTLGVPIPEQGMAVPYRIHVQAEHMSEPVTLDGVFRVARPDRLGGVVES